jgi:hypothetical protein
MGYLQNLWQQKMLTAYFSPWILTDLWEGEIITYSLEIGCRYKIFGTGDCYKVTGTGMVTEGCRI